MSSTVENASTDTRRHLLHALRRVLRPIIRLLIRSGIRYDEFADVARAAFVESAIRDGISGLKNPTSEQIAWVTGISQQRVEHYVDEDDVRSHSDWDATNVATRALHIWHTDQRYLGLDGAPMALPFQSQASLDFRGLVAQVNPSADPAVVLDALLKSKSAARSEDERIRTVTRSFIWPAQSPAGIEHFGKSLENLARTLEHNFNPANANNKFLERSMFADKGIPRSLLPRLHEFAKERAESFLNDLDDWFARFSDSVTDHADTRPETGVYVFMYVEPKSDARALTELTQRQRDLPPAAD